MYSQWGCTSIYRPMSYPFRYLVKRTTIWLTHKFIPTNNGFIITWILHKIYKDPRHLPHPVPSYWLIELTNK